MRCIEFVDNDQCVAAVTKIDLHSVLMLCVTRVGVTCKTHLNVVCVLSVTFLNGGILNRWCASRSQCLSHTFLAKSLSWRY
jgi:hypothetical protein